MRQHLSGWAKHTNGIYKKEKQRLSTIIDDLDKIAETRILSQQEVELKNRSNEKIARLLREEEIKYYQRSKADFILMGDSNQDTSNWSLMGGIGRNVFIVSNKMRGGSKVKWSSKIISPNTTNLFSERRLKGISPLMKPE